MIPKWPQISQGAAMRRDDICIYVSPANRARLEAIIADRNSTSKAVWRARIVLATADGHGTNAIMRRTGKSKPCVWRWQERYIAEGVDGLLRDKTRPSAQETLVGARSGSRCCEDGERDACQRDALEPGFDGGRDGHQPVERGAHLGRGWPEAASRAPVQDLERPAVRGESDRRRRALHEPAGPGLGIVRRREEPDPGARSHAAGPAPEEGPRRRR